MVTIRNERLSDFTAREALIDEGFGASRYLKTAERLREDRLPADGLSFVASEGRRVIGTVRLWDITAGPGKPALLLGPIAVATDCRSRGIGAALMRHAVKAAQKVGHRAVLLVGDAPYYGRFGFSADKTGSLWMPGPYERDRLLACELVPGILDGARGLISPTGRLEPKPDLAALAAHVAREAASARAA